MAQPLSGLLVLDFTTLLPGPLATLMLAEAGAEVIKIEPPSGDFARFFPPRIGSMSAMFAALNAGKRSIVLDLKARGAPERLRPLLARADVLVEQFRPGVMARLGLGYEALKAVNPRLVYCSISGYGQAGPKAGRAGHDLNYQAETGVLSLGRGGAVPTSLVADVGGGSLPAVLNILLALINRERTREGAHLDIAMADGVLAFALPAVAAAITLGQSRGAAVELLTGGSPRYQLYATRDAKWLAVGALEPKFWTAFTKGIGLDPDLADDARDPAATLAAVCAIIASEDARTWEARLGPLDCCVSVVKSLDEAWADPHARLRGLAPSEARAGLPTGVLPVAPAFRRGTLPRAPELGEDTEALLGAAEISARSR